MGSAGHELGCLWAIHVLGWDVLAIARIGHGIFMDWAGNGLGMSS